MIPTPHPTIMIIYLAADHAAFEEKNILKDHLISTGYTVEDLGTDSKESVDYPDYATALCEKMKGQPGARGILFCGSGIGMSIAANRHSHIRAALVSEPLSASLTRRHNNANVLCMGARLTGVDMIKECVDVFLKTPFEGGRHARRLEKLGE